MKIDSKHIGIMFETIIEHNKAVMNAVGQMQDQIKLLATKEDLHKLGIKVDTIQTAVIANRHDHLKLEKRVSRLEVKAS